MTEPEHEHGTILDELLGEADDYALDEEHDGSEPGGSEPGGPPVAEEHTARHDSLSEGLGSLEHEADHEEAAPERAQHAAAGASSPYEQITQQEHHVANEEHGGQQQQDEQQEQQRRKRHAEGDASQTQQEQPPSKKGRIIDLNASSNRSPQKRPLDAPLQRRPAAADPSAPAAKPQRPERPPAAMAATVALDRRRPARYFVIKCANEANFRLSREFNAWATQPHNERMFDEAFAQTERVFLLLSINHTGFFQGCARMASLAGAGPRSVPWEGISLPVNNFSVMWQVVHDLPYSELRDLTNPWNDNKLVKIARDGQELPPELGEELVSRMLAGARASGGPLVPQLPTNARAGHQPGSGARAAGGPGGGGSGRSAPFAADGRLLPHAPPPPPPPRRGGNGAAVAFERGERGGPGGGMRGEWDGPQQQLHRRGRSRSPLHSRRERSRSPDSHLPELLDMSYDEYLEWYNKVQRTMKDMKEVARVSKRSQGSRDVAADMGAGAGSEQEDTRGSSADGLVRGAGGGAPGQLFNAAGQLPGAANAAAGGGHAGAVAGGSMRGVVPAAAIGAVAGGMGAAFGMGAGGGGLMGNMMSEDDYIRQCQLYYQRNGFPAPDAEMIRAYYRSVRANLEGGMMAAGAMPGMVAMPGMGGMMMGMAGAMGRGGMAAMPGMMGAAMVPMMGRGMAAMRGRPPQHGMQRGDYF